MLFKLHLQVVFDDLFNGLNWTIGWRMINRREVLLNADFITKFPKFLTIELCAIIRNDLLRYAISAYYYLPYEVLDLFIGDSGKQFGFCPFCKIIDRDRNVLEGRSHYR